jgi:Fe-S-cluster containining protein
VTYADSAAVDFFKAMHQRFDHIIAETYGSERMLSALLTLAFSSYEGTVALQSEAEPEPDCTKGCATCCTLRVVATAPEVFLVARYLRAVGEDLKAQGINVRQRLAAADEVTRSCSEQQRVGLRQRCPYIHKGVCVIYAVRPLACRSHISYSRKACFDAAAGNLDAVPNSEMHMNVRSLVQNAMQSALRDASYPWVAYELNHALSIVLDNPAAEQSWLDCQDVLAPAMVQDVDSMEMAATFDRIMGRTM